MFNLSLNSMWVWIVSKCYILMRNLINWWQGKLFRKRDYHERGIKPTGMGWLIAYTWVVDIESGS